MTRRGALAAGAGLALTSCIGSTDDAFPYMHDDEATIAAWVERHRDDLPTDYDALALLPSPYRGAVFLRLSPEARSALVQEHLRRCVAARPWLTTEQRDVIDLARESLTPAWYDTTFDDRQRRSKSWGPPSLAAFGTSEWILIFGSIGPEDEAIRKTIEESMGAFLVVPGSGPDDSTAIDPSMKEANAAFDWLDENRATLPTEYDALDRLPRRRRHLALDALPIGTASALVRERIRRCADADHAMTDAQRATIASTLETLSPAWFQADAREREAHWKHGFWPSIRAAFTWEEWGRIFGDVGDEVCVLRARYSSGPAECAETVGW
jgi:hypothetical protein